MRPQARGHKSLLPHFLATLYGLAIVYASLQPFTNWMAPVPGAPFFLFAPWPPRWVRYDIITNVARLRPRSDSSSGWSRAGAAPRAQLALGDRRRRGPVARDGNAADVPADARRERRRPHLQRRRAPRSAARSPWPSRARRGRGVAIASARERWFLPGSAGDIGLALLAIWLAVQANPAIPLFAAMYDSSPRRLRPSRRRADSPRRWSKARKARSSCWASGLFVALLMRERRHVAGAVLLLIGAAAIVKGVAATVLLSPAAGEHWLTPGVALGVAAGSLLLALAIRLPRSAQVTLATIALLSSLLATLFAPDLLFARAPIGLFNGPYGHLLNFNGLTHTVLLLWPAVASTFLFALAGRPGWGEPG